MRLRCLIVVRSIPVPLSMMVHTVLRPSVVSSAMRSKGSGWEGCATGRLSGLPLKALTPVGPGATLPEAQHPTISGEIQLTGRVEGGPLSKERESAA